MAASGEGNHIACDQAAKILLKLLDDVLNEAWSGGHGKSAGAAVNRPPENTDDIMSFMDRSENPSEHFPYADLSCDSGEDVWRLFDATNLDFTALLGQEPLSHGY